MNIAAYRAATLLCISISITACAGRSSGAAAADASAASTSKQSATPDRGGRGGGGGGPAAAVPVVIAAVASKAIPVTLPAVGNVTAISTVRIQSQVTGQLNVIHFKEGDEVKQGELLLEIDPLPFRATLAQAEAALARDTATAENQKSTLARETDLFQRGLVAKSDFDASTAAAGAAQATLAVDRAAVETARLNLEHTRIIAPISGKTGSLGAHIGDVVHTADTTPIVVINQVSPIYVSFAVPGRYLPDIRKYQAQTPLVVQSRPQSAPMPGAPPAAPANATPDISSEAVSASETGHVTFIDNAVDPTTGTVVLKATFDNADRALWPGLFAQVTLNLTTEARALVVPASAVQASQNGQYVYALKEDCTADMRTVTVERQQGDQMVIAQGVSDEEEVVTDGQLRLVPGSHVVTQSGRCAQPEG